MLFSVSYIDLQSRQCYVPVVPNAGLGHLLKSLQTVYHSTFCNHKKLHGVVLSKLEFDVYTCTHETRLRVREVMCLKLC